MDEKKHLRGAVSWQKKAIPVPERLGGSVEAFFKARESKMAQAGRIIQAWEEILPEALRRHSRPGGFVGGVLTVEVDPGPYLHQMQMIQNELIIEIRNRCPRCGLRKIRILPMGAGRE